MTAISSIDARDSVKDSTFGIAVSIAAGITTLAIFFRRLTGLIWRVIASPVRWFKEQSEAARLTRVVAAEVTTNGGGSLKDAVRRIETRCERVEESLVASGQRLKALLTDGADGMFELDAKGGLVWANRTLCRLLGKQSDELVGRGWERCVAADERADVIEEWDRSVRVDRELAMNIHFVTSRGEPLFLQVHTYPFKNIKGDTIGFIARCSVIPAEMERK